jgi:hypothetical protein
MSEEIDWTAASSRWLEQKREQERAALETPEPFGAEEHSELACARAELYSALGDCVDLGYLRGSHRRAFLARRLQIKQKRPRSSASTWRDARRRLSMCTPSSTENWPSTTYCRRQTKIRNNRHRKENIMADVKTPEATIMFSKDLFELNERENGSKNYGCTLAFKKGTDLSALHKVVLDCIKEAWPGKPVEEWIKDGTIKNPFLDGDGKQGKDSEGNPKPGYAGTTFIRCTSGEKFKPKVFDRARNPVFEMAEVPSGSKVLAVVNPYAWDNPKNGKGVSFGISLVQVVKKASGEEILGGGGGPDPDKFFEKIEDEGDAPAETKGGAGAAGLFG